jgi:hypothetical protein
VKWSTVHLTLILTTLLGYHSRQVDFVQAFSQADIDCDVYMKIHTMPPSWDHELKLKKNLYGLHQVGLQCGFWQSIVDPCLFLHPDCILVVYVDDCLLFSKEPTMLDDLIGLLQKEFILTIEGDVGTFLGIDIKRHPDGKLELLQPGLIQKIVMDCAL